MENGYLKLENAIYLLGSEQYVSLEKSNQSILREEVVQYLGDINFHKTYFL